jgi:hypothetical protein
MQIFFAGAGIGALAASSLWWIYVRHLSGVTSDLQDIGSDLKHATAQVTSAAQQVQQAVTTATKS